MIHRNLQAMATKSQTVRKYPIPRTQCFFQPSCHIDFVHHLNGGDWNERNMRHPSGLKDVFKTIESTVYNPR